MKDMWYYVTLRVGCLFWMSICLAEGDYKTGAIFVLMGATLKALCDIGERTARQSHADS